MSHLGHIVKLSSLVRHTHFNLVTRSHITLCITHADKLQRKGPIKLRQHFIMTVKQVGIKWVPHRSGPHPNQTPTPGASAAADTFLL